MYRLQIIFLFCVSATSVFGQAINTIQVLLPNQTIERGLGGGETHRYQVTLGADEFLQVRAEQKGIDIELKIAGANGKQLAVMDSPNGIAGSEMLSWAAQTAGEYEIEVSSPDPKARAGTYILKRENSRQTTAKDRRRVEIERIFYEGMTARNAGGQTATAIVKFEEALRGWRELQENDLAEMTARQVKLQKGFQAFSEGVKFYNGNTPESWRAAVLKFDEAGKIYHETGEKAFEAYSLDYAGNISNLLGEKQKAREFYNRALLLVRNIGNKKEESILLNKLGLLASFFGEKQKALEFYNQALLLHRELGDKNGEAIALNNIGTIYDDLGDNQKSLEFYNQALLITKANGNKNGEAIALGNISSIYSGIGEKPKALEYFNEA